MRDYSEATIREKYRKLTLTLIERGITVTTMESATAGQIASLITDTEGSSAVLKGAFVTYSNEAKIMQGVPTDIIEKYSVYSLETASEMAKACRNTYVADIGIGITGTLGNVDPANAAASCPGKVYFAIAFKGGAIAEERVLMDCPSRFAYKMAVAGEIVDRLMKLLDEKFSNT